jgi:hypothetical protein
MALDLRVAAAERHQHAEGEQLARRHVDATSGEVVAEAVGRQIALDVLLIGGRGGVELLDNITPDDLLLNRQALLGASLGPGRGNATSRSVSTSFVAWMKSKTLAMPTYGTAW